MSVCKSEIQQSKNSKQKTALYMAATTLVVVFCLCLGVGVAYAADEGAPSIITEPNDGTVARNNELVISVTAELPPEPDTGWDGTLSYQWYTNKTGSNLVEESTLIEGASNSNFRVPTGAHDTGYNYYFCVVTNTFDEGTVARAVTRVVRILVISDVPAATPIVAMHSSDAIYGSGLEAQPLKVKAIIGTLGSGTLSYQWYRSDTHTTKPAQASPIFDATSAEYTPPTSDVGTTYYFCVVTNTFEEVKTARAASAAVAITVEYLADDAFITTPEELATFATRVNSGVSYRGKTVTLMNDIDLSAYENWTPVGHYEGMAPESNKSFQGTFEGNGYRITGLNCSGTLSAKGLFGYASEATIRNLSVEGTVSGQTWSGGVVGRLRNGIIENVTFSGSVTSEKSFAGGIVGICLVVSENTFIRSCTNNATVSGFLSVGGILGYAAQEETNNITIDSCKNTGDIVSTATSAEWYEGIGGIVGWFGFGPTAAPSSISNCYNTGSVISEIQPNAGGIVGQLFNKENYSLAVVNNYNAGKVSYTGVEHPGYYGGIIGSLDIEDDPQTTVENNFSLNEMTFNDRDWGCDQVGTNQVVWDADTQITPLSTEFEIKNIDNVSNNYGGGLLWEVLNSNGSTCFKVDYTPPLNYGFPILAWEEPAAATYDVKVNVAPAEADLLITNEANKKTYRDYTGSDEERVYSLPAGDYTWTATKSGYITEAGSFTVTDTFVPELTIDLIMSSRYDISFAVDTEDGLPFTGDIYLWNDDFGPVAVDNLDSVTVPTGDFNYKIAAPGYKSETGVITVFDDDLAFYTTLMRESVWEGDITEPAEMDYDEVDKYWDITVYTASELAWIADKVATENDEYGSAHITLANDIVLNFEGDTTNQWFPIGRNGSEFYGSFDGGGYRISNMYINTDDNYAGLFGVIGEPGYTTEIRNVVVNGEVISSGDTVAGLVAFASIDAETVIIENCGNECSITSTNTVGGAEVAGILGLSWLPNTSTLEISGCYNKGPIEGTLCYSAGILGYDVGSLDELSNCYNTASVNTVGDSFSGGLVGCSYTDASLSGLYNVGAIVGETNSKIGSLAGALSYPDASLENSALWLAGTADDSVGYMAGTDKDNSTKVTTGADITVAALGDTGAFKEGVPGYNQGLPLLQWEKIPLGNAEVTISVDDLIYSGIATKPQITLTTDDGRTLIEGVDFKVVEYKNAAGNTIPFDELVEAGYYSVVVESIGSIWQGSLEGSFAITKELEASMVTPLEPQIYTGSALEPSLEIIDNGYTLVENSDYTFIYSNNTNIGTASVEIRGAGAYTGVVTINFEIVSEYTNILLSDLIVGGGVILSGAKVSVDGTDVYEDEVWVTQADADALQAALDRAQAVIANPTTSEGERQAAGEGLEDAIDAFGQALNAGTKKRSDDIALWTRLGGTNRYGTMSALIGTGFTTAPTVVIASGDAFPDALAASGFAGLTKMPTLLTSGQKLSSETRSELLRLGVAKAYIIGGEPSVAPSVEQEIQGLGIQTSRIAGAHREETALKLYEAGQGWGDTAIVTNGARFADALSVSPYAYAKTAPLFLTNAQGDINQDVLDTLIQAGFSRILVLGSDNAVSEATFDTLVNEGLNPLRIGGAHRYETSALIADFAISEGMNHDKLALTAGHTFPDALSASSVCGTNNTVLLLVNDGAHGEASYHGIDTIVAPNITLIKQGYVLGDTNSLGSKLYEDVSALR